MDPPHPIEHPVTLPYGTGKDVKITVDKYGHMITEKHDHSKDAKAVV